ncbi:MAG TPA: disulfide bond formation protein B [Pseudolabrys sp.]|nr:disulfide bond formation protein B [Pseudolabrys sp.]
MDRASSIRTLGLLGHLYLVLMLVTIAGILTAAMVMQYAFAELPCPLCLLQRVALFGVCFAVMYGLRHGDNPRVTGLGLAFSILLLIVSVRQTLLDIYPRPGHEYIGSAVFGLHMPVWSVLIAVALIAGYALKLVVFGDTENRPSLSSYPTLQRIAAAASIYVIVLCAINLGSVVLQCGLEQCHTDRYLLLQKLR